MPSPQAAPGPKPKKHHEGGDRDADSGLLKTSVPPGKETNYRKVAKFLVLVGKDEAARILARLEPAQVEKVTREIAGIQRIEAVEAEALLAEFRTLLASGFLKTAGTGGINGAREILNAAFGKDRGEALLRKAVPESVGNPFDFLEDFDGAQIAILLKDEAPVTISLVLSRLDPKIAAAVISALDSSTRLEVLRRIAHLGATAPDVLARVALALREKAHKVGKSTGETVDGRSALAEILKHSDTALGERLLGELEEADPDLGRELKERLYTLDDVIKAEDRPLQQKLHTMENRDIAILLKTRRPAFVEKILSNLSTTRRATVEEEREMLGPLPKKEVDAVASAFLAWFRAARENGKILLVDDTDLVN